MAIVDMPALVEDVGQRTDGSPLNRIEAALVVSAELVAGADELVGYFVAEARRSGCSWTEIGQQIGVSKQAARQRFTQQLAGPRDPRRQRRRRGKMAEQQCSFCGKSRSSFVELVAGPGVWICAPCIDLAGEIVAERTGGPGRGLGPQL